MQIIKSTAITDDNFVSSDIPEVMDGYPEWDATTSYVIGQRVVVLTHDGAGVHNVYEAVWSTGNLNKFPPDYLSGTPPIYWTYLFKTNRWLLFDNIVAPQRAMVETNNFGTAWRTTDAVWQPDTVWSSLTYSSMQVAILPGDIDTVALMNTDATSLQIVMNDPFAGEVYSEVKIPSVNTYYNAIYSDLPSYPNATLSVIIVNNNGEAACGELIVGKIATLGKAKYGVNVGINDYSVKENDQFGNFNIVERAYSRRMDVDFFTEINLHAGVMSLLEKYRATPLVWIISTDYDATVIYGFYRNAEMTLANPSFADGSVSIEGLGADYVHTTPVPPYVPPWDGYVILDLWGMNITIEALADLITETPVNTGDEIALVVPDLSGSISVGTLLYISLGTCTISNASPAVVTCSSHGLSENDKILFHTTGTLPAPLIVDRIYFVGSSPGADTFNIRLTSGGSTVDTTTSGSGTHTLLTEA
jgi:hypothetical protein